MIRVPAEAIEAGAKALDNEHRIGNLEKSLSVIEAAMPAIREAIAQEIKEWEASLPDPGARIGPILRIVRGV